MANVRNGNTFFIDTASGSGGAKLAELNVLVLGVTVSPSGGAATLTLADAQSPAVVKLTLTVPSGVAAQYYDFSENPILFPNGIDPTAATTVQATAIVRLQGEGR